MVLELDFERWAGSRETALGRHPNSGIGRTEPHRRRGGTQTALAGWGWVWTRAASQREVRLGLHGRSDSGESGRSGRGAGMSSPFSLLSLLVPQSQKPGAGGLPRECKCLTSASV